MVPVTLRNRSVTVRVDGDGISHISAYTLKHRHFRHASSRFRKNQLQVDLSSSVSAAVMVANIVFFPQPLGIDIQQKGAIWQETTGLTVPWQETVT